jgi:hypothetical protein
MTTGPNPAPGINGQAAPDEHRDQLRRVRGEGGTHGQPAPDEALDQLHRLRRDGGTYRAIAAASGLAPAAGWKHAAGTGTAPDIRPPAPPRTRNHPGTGDQPWH